MATIIAPPRLGAHEGLANARVTVVKYEPFAASNHAFPTLKITAGASAPIHSTLAASVQVFPAIPVGTYTVSLNDANGWIIHPEDIVAHADRVTVTAGSTTDTILRVFRPSTLVLESVTDYYGGAAITHARLTLTRLSDGKVIAGSVGQFTLTGLVPDAYDIRISATAYHDILLTSVNIPGGYPGDLVHEISAVMQPLVPPTTTTTTTSTTTTTVAGTTTTVAGTTTTTAPSSTTTTQPPGTVTVEFTVTDNTGMVVAGATVRVNHPTRGLLTAVTDAYGRTTLNLETGMSFTSTASTPWGHGPDNETFNPTSQRDIDHRLKQPNNMGTMTLTNGSRAEFLYSGGGPWIAMPANYQGEASFVAFGGWYDVAKRCLANGSVKGEKEVSVRSGRNRETSISGYCP
jgi:hypothetical protein